LEYLYQVLQEKGVSFILGPDGSFQEAIVEDGIAVGVVTTNGKRHKADQIVLAAGSWSPYIIPELKPWLTSLGQPVIHIRVPEHLVKKYSSPNFPVWTGDITKTGFYGFPISPDTGLLKMAHHGPGFVSKMEPNGRGSDGTIGLPPEAVTLFSEFISKYFPDLTHSVIASSRMCWYTDSLDGDFYICQSPTVSGVVYATGGSGHGFKFMPRIGGIVMDVIQERETVYTKRFGWREPKSTGPGKDGCRQQGTEGPRAL
jgi:sarcosine oxidase/L-pipecolate oxidase